MTEKKIIIKRCRDICSRNNKKDSEDIIKKEYPGCSVTIDMTYSEGGCAKMFMGMMLYKNLNISF